MSWQNIFRGLTVGQIANDHRIRYVDVGARDGFQPDLWPLAFAVDAVGFEPEPNEFARLSANPDSLWASVRYLPHAISADGGEQTLFVSRDRAGASLLPPNGDLGRQFDKPQFFDIEATVATQTVTLTEALETTEFEAIDYLKIDIEGAEFAVFQSAPEVLNNTLALRTEAFLRPAREGQGLARDLDGLLSEHGFQLLDISGQAKWRRQGYVVHPFVSPASPPYARGQLIHGDFLYIRDPETLDGQPDRLLKLALIAMALGYFDHALMILERPPVCDGLIENYGAAPDQVVHQASRVFGRKAFRQAFWRHIRGLAPFIRYMPNALRR